jgi:hypothetical protein
MRFLFGSKPKSFFVSCLSVHLLSQCFLLKKTYTDITTIRKHALKTEEENMTQYYLFSR